MPGTPVPPARAFPRSLWLAAVLALSLAACFSSSPSDISKDIDEGQAAHVLPDIIEELQGQPQSPVWHALGLKARLAICGQTNCPIHQPDEMDAIAQHLKVVTGPVTLEQTLTLDPAQMLAAAAPAFAQLPDQPAPLLKLLSITPPSSRPAVADALFTQPLMQLRAAGYPSATTTLVQFTRANNAQGGIGTLYRQWAGAMAGLLTGTEEQIQANLTGLKSEPSSTLPATGLKLLPHVLFARNIAVASGTTSFIGTFSTTLAGWQLPNLLGPTARRPIAQEVNHLRQDEKFLARALATWQPSGGKTQGPGTVVTSLSPTVALTDPGVSLQLHLANLSLQLDAAQPDLWREFLPLASRYVQASGDAGVFSNLSLTGLPPAQQQQVVTELFQLIQKQAATDQPILPILQQLAQLQLDKPSATRLEKLVQTGIEGAISNKRLDEVLAYARFKPELARANKAGITPLVVEDIREALRRNDFGHATGLASLLNETLGIDFNLDALLLQEFADHLEASKAVEALSADTPEWLLQPAGTADYDLGPLWEFMTIHFGDQPRILNDTLRNLIAGVRGNWGTPTAMARLNHAFDDRDFNPEARRQYLLNAIATSLIDDVSLTPEKRLGTAARLKLQYPELSLAPVVEAALKESRTLEDSRTLWQNAPQPVRQVIAAVRPQFASLMRGVDSWQSGDRTTAAQAFAKVTDAAYTSQLAPYLQQIGEELTTTTGLYANLGAPGGLPTVALRVDVPAFAAVTETDANAATPSLSQLRISVLNRLGTLSQPEAATFATNHAALKTAAFTTGYNLSTHTAAIPTLTLQRASAPAPFESTFGNLKSLTFTSGSLVVTPASGNPVRFTRLLVSGSVPLWPDGRYSLTTPHLSVVTSETEPLATLLPPGSLIELAADPADADGTTFGVTGQLWHPGLSQPQEVTGRYNPVTLSTDLTWLAPLANGTAKAVGRCQTVPGRIVCAAHYTHAARQQYRWQISGAQTSESLAETRTRLESRNSVLASENPGAAQLLTRLNAAPMEFVSRTIENSLPAGSLTVLPSATVPAQVSSTPAVTPTAVATPTALPMAAPAIPVPAPSLLSAPSFTNP